MTTLRRIFGVIGYRIQGDNLRRFNREMSGASAGMRDAGERARDARGRFIKMGSGARQAASGLDGLEGEAKSLGSTLGGLKTIAVGVAGALAAMGLGELFKQVFESNVEFEKLSASLETVEGDADKAAAAFGRIEKFAASTPFQLNEVAEAFIKLKALGLDPSERALTSYGNTASAMGKSLNDMIEAVADASTGEFERLKEFGIKSSSQGNKVKFTFRGVTTEVGKNAKEIQEYLLKIGENQFAGGMARQSKTLGGVMSTAKDNVAAFAREIGKGGLNDALRELIQSFSVSASGGKELARDIGKFLGDALRKVADGVRFVVKNWKAFAALATAGGLVALIAKVVLFIGGLGGLKAALLAAGAAVAPFLAVLLKVLIPVGLVVAALVAVGLVLEDLYFYFKGGDSAIGRFIAKFREASGPIGDLARAVEAFLPKMKELGETIVEGMKAGLVELKPVFDEFGEFFGEVFDDLKAVAGEVASAIFGESASGLDGITATMDGVINAVRVGMPVVVSIVKTYLRGVLLGWRVTWGAVKFAVGAFVNFFRTAYTALSSFAAPVVEALGRHFEAVFTRVRVILAIFREVFAAVWQAIQPVVAPVLEWISSAVGTAIEAVVSAFQSIQSAVAPVFNWLGEAFAKVIDFISAGIQTLLDGLIGVGKLAAEALGVDMKGLEAKIANINASVTPPPTAVAAGGASGQAAIGQAQAGGKGVGTQNNTVNAGGVTTVINMTTNAGPNEVANAASRGTSQGLQGTATEMARNAAGGAA